MILSRVPFDNIVKKITTKSLLLWPIIALLPPNFHWTKDTHALFPKIFHLPLTKIHPKNLLLMIQHIDDTFFFQPLILDLVNHIELYYGSYPMTRVLFYHDIKALHSIGCCPDFRSKLVFIELIQHSFID